MLEKKVKDLVLSIGILGKKVEEPAERVTLEAAAADEHIEDFLAGNKQFDVNDRADKYRLMNC